MRPSAGPIGPVPPAPAAPGKISAYTGYTGGDLGSLSPNSSTLNLEPTGTQSVVGSALSINTLNLTSAYGVTMTSVLTLAGGGLIGNTIGQISSGTLQGSRHGGELIVVTPQNLTIGSVIANNGGPTALTKAGPATLILTGINTYSGVTTIGEGILQIGSGRLPAPWVPAL